MYACHSLYNNTSGTNGTVTLSETSANFAFIRIFYKSNDGFYGSVDVYASDGKTAWLASGWIDRNLYGNQKLKTVKISGTAITTVNYVEVNIDANITSANNYIYITRVDGYR